MASTKTLNAANLAALGADRLAALLMEVSEGSAIIKRRLRLELASSGSPAELSKEVRKRLATIARSRTFVDWQGRKALRNDLDMQRRAIVEQIAPRFPAEALSLIWQFLDMAKSVLARVDDSSGAVGEVFRTAIGDIGGIAQAARADPKELAGQAAAALLKNSFGEFDGLIQALQPALGAQGMAELKDRIIAASREKPAVPKEADRKVMGWSTSGPLYADQADNFFRDSAIRRALMDIADAQGDVDAYAGQWDEKARKAPKIAAKIALRLIAADRAAEALGVIDAAAPQHSGGWPDHDWEDARIAALDALERSDEAQAQRWSCFERSLSAGHLREYLKRLADFDDFDAEQRALDLAAGHGSLLQALSFLVSWPALDRAARLVETRADELDGNYYEIMTPAAEALAGRYPLAATLLFRAMIDFALTKARTSRYGHAARHLRDCAGLAESITDWRTVETHQTYTARLRQVHGRKTGFWSAT